MYTTYGQIFNVMADQMRVTLKEHYVISEGVLIVGSRKCFEGAAAYF